MTDDNPFRGLLGLGLQSSHQNGLLDNLLVPQPEHPFSALARALGSPPPPTPPNNSLAAVIRLLEDATRPAPSALQSFEGLARFLGTEAPSGSNALSGLGIPQQPPAGTANPFSGFGIPQQTPVSAPPAVPPINTLPDVRRRTFFSFQFSDSFRVNQVRQSWRIRPKTNDPRAPLWFHDSSIWEKSQRTNEESLKQLIRDGLNRTSVTVVLAGATTFSRRWVRYEIARSVLRGNGLITVQIHGLECPNTGYAEPGPNPLDHMGLYMKRDGSFRLCERNDDGDWWPYDDFTGPVRCPRFLTKPTVPNKPVALSTGADAHDYCDDGYSNLSAWIQAAAVKAGR